MGTPVLARPEGLEPPFSGIGIRCVIQLRHGRMYAREKPARILYYTFSKKSIRQRFPDLVLRLLRLLKLLELRGQLQQPLIVARDFNGR